MKKRYVILLGFCIFLLSSPSILFVTSANPALISINIETEIPGYSLSDWMNNFLPPWISSPKNLGNAPLNILPTVSITSPLANDTVADSILITGTANDSDGQVYHVEVSIDRGPWITATGTTTWTYQWAVSYTHLTLPTN